MLQSSLLRSSERLCWLGKPRCAVCTPEGLEEGLMSKKIDILQMVVRFILPLKLLLRFSGMDALENAQPPAFGESISSPRSYRKHPHAKCRRHNTDARVLSGRPVKPAKQVIQAIVDLTVRQSIWPCNRLTKMMQSPTNKRVVPALTRSIIVA
jgi:hypothetical protein